MVKTIIKEDTQKTLINKSTFSIHITYKDNWIGNTGTTSLSEALKTNTTLTILDLSREDKRKKTYERNEIIKPPSSNPPHQQRMILDPQEQRH